MPTDTFSIAASGDDANVGSTAYSTYPGTSNFTDDTSTNARCEKAFYGAGDGWYRESVFRWDTSSIPDDATVTGATAIFWSFGKQDNEARSVTLEWYAFDGSVALGDWTATVGSSAHAGRTIASLAITADESFTLLSPAANINKTGYTGLRMFISGGAPANINYWDTSMWDHATNPAPRLQVTYDEFQGSATVAWITA